MSLGETGLNQGRPVLSNILQSAVGSLSSVVTVSMSHQRVLMTRGILLKDE